MDYSIRPVERKDHSALTEIYNYYIENSYAAYRENKVDNSFVEILKKNSHDYPFYVIETADGKIAGFGLIHPYHLAETFKRTAELTYFLAPEQTSRGMGTKLLQKLMDDATAMGIDTLLASISSRNEQSLNFHKKHGFIECGRFKRIGKKWENDFDMVWMQKYL